MFPVDLEGIERCDVGLGASRVPKHFVVVPALLVRFTLKDFLMLQKSDGALLTIYGFRKDLLAHHWLHQPLKIDRQVLESPQVDVGPCSSLSEGQQEVIGTGVDDAAAS